MGSRSVLPHILGNGFENGLDVVGSLLSKQIKTQKPEIYKRRFLVSQFFFVESH